MGKDIIFCPVVKLNVNKSIFCHGKECNSCLQNLPEVPAKRKKREDSLSDNYYTKKKKYKGRSKGWDHDIFAEANAIMSGKTLQKWQKDFNMSASEYSALQLLAINFHPYLYSSEEQTFPLHRVSGFCLRDFSQAAIQIMMDEIDTLMITLEGFFYEVKKAEKEGNTIFLNTVKEVFGDDASYYMDYKKGRGANQQKKVLEKSYRVFNKWLSVKKNIKLPKTFYEREKLKGLCCLAHSIHSLIFGALMKRIKQKEATLKIKLLAEKYDLAPGDIFPELEYPQNPPSKKGSIPKYTKKNKPGLKRRRIKNIEDRLQNETYFKKYIDMRLSELTDI